jgi:tripartite-type tricarboxylate transporter receptor subunit TctC
MDRPSHRFVDARMLASCAIAPLLALGSLAVRSASAPAYPVKPIRIVTAEPGGGNDFAARTLGQAVGPHLGQQWVVDNRGGAGGMIAADIVAKAAPDGYTLLVYASNIWIIPLLRRDVPYTMNDLAPVSWVARSPNILVVHPSIAVHSVQELIQHARTYPGKLSYASGGAGSTTHLAAELFKSMAKLDIVWVPYKGNSPALIDLAAGRVQLMFGTASSVAPYVKSGRLKAIAVTSTEPSVLAPGLPTVAAAGLPGYESGSIYGVFAPARTPRGIVDRLNAAIVAMLQTPAVKDRFLASGVETVGSTPERFAEVIRTDTARMSKVIKDAGIRVD